MGYIHRNPLTFIELPNAVGFHFAISSVQTTIDFGILGVPSWMKNRVKKAFLDLYIPLIYNMAANINEINGDQVMQVRGWNGITNTAWEDAISFPDDSLQMLSSSNCHIGRIIGSYDISTSVNFSVGNHIDIRWLDALSSLDYFFAINTFCVVRVVE